MKTRIVIALASCCAFGGILALAAEDENTSEPSELAALRAQVQALETRVAMLEKRFQTVPPDPNAMIQPPSLHGRPVPENWRRREFNGMPYYVIPLRNDPNHAPRPRR